MWHRSAEVVQEMSASLETQGNFLHGMTPSDIGSISTELRDLIISTFVAAAARTSVADHLSIAEKMMPADAKLTQVLAMGRVKSLLHRKAFRVDESTVVAQQCLERAIGSSQNTGRLAQYLSVSLRLSLAENAILRNDFRAALELATTALECFSQDADRPGDLVRQAQTVIGRTARYQGRFHDAEYTFRVCGDFSENVSKVAVSHLKRQLADMLTEQGCLDEAGQVLDAQLSSVEDGTKTYRRLLLARGDVYMRSDRAAEARTIFERIDEYFCAETPLEPADQLDHVHARIKLIAICKREGKLDEIEPLATGTLEFMAEYRSFTSSNFYKRVVLNYRAGAALARAAADVVAANQCHPGPRHFITGLGTYERAEQSQWLEDLHGQVTGFLTGGNMTNT